MMFGKNYDEKIEQLTEANNNNFQAIKDLRELFDSLQDSMIDIAKVQAQHKQFIQFFVNHGTVDSEAQEDLIKMIQEIAKKPKRSHKTGENKNGIQ